jgi:hypothetical protein
MQLFVTVSIESVGVFVIGRWTKSRPNLLVTRHNTFWRTRRSSSLRLGTMTERPRSGDQLASIGETPGRLAMAADRVAML